MKSKQQIEQRIAKKRDEIERSDDVYAMSSTEWYVVAQLNIEIAELEWVLSDE